MKNMNYSSQSIILAFSALLTTLWTLREREKESSLKARSTSYIVHFLFSRIAYRTCRTVGAGGIWCPDNLVHMRNCW